MKADIDRAEWGFTGQGARDLEMEASFLRFVSYYRMYFYIRDVSITSILSDVLSNA